MVRRWHHAPKRPLTPIGSPAGAEPVGLSYLPLVAGNAILPAMAKFTNTVMIKDGGKERAVKVTIDGPCPDDVDVQLFAQEAWLTREKRIKVGLITVRVQKFGR